MLLFEFVDRTKPLTVLEVVLRYAFAVSDDLDPGRRDVCAEGRSHLVDDPLDDLTVGLGDDSGVFWLHRR